MASDVHPAFTEIIKQLSSEEAMILKIILCSSEPEPIFEILLTPSKNMNGGDVLDRHIMNLRDSTTSKAIESPRQAAMIDNCIRLGLVEVKYNQGRVWGASFYHMGKKFSGWIEKRPEYLKQKERENDKKRICVGLGVVNRTFFGFQFARAVGLLESN